MRPWGDAGPASLDAGLPLAAFLIEDAAGRIGSGDFLREGNLFSVAAEKGLKIHVEVCLDDFAAFTSAWVAEDQVVPDSPIQRRRQIEVYCLVVDALDCEESIADAVTGGVGLLLFVQNEEVDVCAIVRRVNLAGERLEDSMEMRLGCMGGNFERECGQPLQIECFLQNGLRGAYWRGSDSIQRFNSFY
jgi:hypothetical protein